jgi:signal transduction histidine kinase/CheY-like chemotaxis protein
MATPESPTTLLARSGEEKSIATSCAPILDRNGRLLGAVAVFRDVTQQLKVDEELRKRQKLESIGILAGGIAHDFNNILTGTLGNLHLARQSLSRDRDPGKYLAGIEEATERARGLTQQLLTFSKGGAPVKKAMNVANLVRESATFPLRGCKSVVEFSVPDDLWNCEVDEGQIAQVIGNLVINADQAMAKGGRIRISVENMIVGPGDTILLSSGRYVRISVTDEGKGIPPENVSKLFDPYFSTKPDGTGLGLATSYSIIKNHSGQIAVESEDGAGSTFHIYIPATNKEVPESASMALSASAKHARILIVDDDPVIRNIVSEMMTDLGYEVQVAEEGSAAVDMYRQAIQTGARFDVVILDLTIPGGVGGRDAAAMLLEIDPDARCIVSSGYSNDPVMADYRNFGFLGIVSKPYRIESLVETVNSVLSQEPA